MPAGRSIQDAGASLLFPPGPTTAAAAHTEWQPLGQRDPRVCGVEQTRWTLARLRQAGSWLGGLTLAGVPTVLRRARIVWKRARASMRSPDPDDDAKLADVEAAVAAAQAQPGRGVIVYLDEVTVERQPTVANAYAPTGSSAQARAVRSPKFNTVTRILGALNALTGGVFYRRASKITGSFLVAFYQALCRAYPDAERIDVIQDNWPGHTHPDLRVALEPQETRWPW